jgi:hypothetical protein
MTKECQNGRRWGSAESNFEWKSDMGGEVRSESQLLRP